ncbi:helix-turn-helix domain-containing protein [Halorientalis pallida]|nr:helix-turn-helix domain-containing protein [Halorientalis pallida]
MSVIAEFTIAADAFALGRLIADQPALQIELERVVPIAKRVMPYVRGHGDDLDGIEGRLAADPSVESVQTLDRAVDSARFRVEWAAPVEEFAAGLAAANASVLRVTGEAEWGVRVRFEDHVGLGEFTAFCHDNDIDYTLERVATAETPGTGNPFGLTDVQYETLVEATQRGYFDIPRSVTLAAIAADLGVSEQAVSERLRRGIATVLERILLDSPR